MAPAPPTLLIIYNPVAPDAYVEILSPVRFETSVLIPSKGDEVLSLILTKDCPARLFNMILAVDVLFTREFPDILNPAILPAVAVMVPVIVIFHLGVKR